jgi:hypothetical protein
VMPVRPDGQAPHSRPPAPPSQLRNTCSWRTPQPASAALRVVGYALGKLSVAHDAALCRPTLATERGARRRTRAEQVA